jgi:hypothetical protein
VLHSKSETETLAVYLFVAVVASCLFALGLLMVKSRAYSIPARKEARKSLGPRPHQFEEPWVEPSLADSEPAPKPAPKISAATAFVKAVPVSARQIADLMVAGEGFEPSTSGL